MSSTVKAAAHTRHYLGILSCAVRVTVGRQPLDPPVRRVRSTGVASSRAEHKPCVLWIRSTKVWDPVVQSMSRTAVGSKSCAAHMTIDPLWATGRAYAMLAINMPNLW